ncbi:hypothetical protein TTHERM_00670230 (macronuclear) [Tetrahymena thermophila SB210]|uniref:Uncharacterized protein n=1 Tax=Tetrahymena thermophila (strain SB210) TaxID=312017 RepID=I7MJA4_TETTS|nr:hypothetical protein TTHERM_00670230 [Tetrahymena thermophila SB210]EAS06099.1 hypothetical protein TTHERM_00670230 [Tetrahymena thermophila SB210]|eukprot:XP_001026344.1 hypothetical protein TTHERM_00670230 [Tetrahymena thermophila SB210]
MRCQSNNTKKIISRIIKKKDSYNNTKNLEIYSTDRSFKNKRKLFSLIKQDLVKLNDFVIKLDY